MKNILRLVLVALFAGAVSFKVEAAVLTNDAVLGPSPFSTNKLLTLTVSTASFGLFAFEIEALSPSQYKFTSEGIAEGYALFLMTTGTVLDAGFTLATSPILSNNGIDTNISVQSFTLNQSQYFGFWDDRNRDYLPDNDDNYGWVKLTRNNSGLILSSGATAIGGGIIIGTVTQGPEPSVTALLLCGGVLFAGRRKRLTANPVLRR